MYPITILSFGYLHGKSPKADIVVDLRELLADPAHRPEGEMLDMTGMDAAVLDFVFRTPGAIELYYDILRTVTNIACLKPVTVAFGCAGGRHRSVAFASEFEREVEATHGMSATARHLHVHLPRVIHQQS